ncbi:MAG: hypothetical protein FWD82_01775 [Defluviitaleaceae bacterium]|nr:hypothetical protein [Defluviitaleaceae bacterium]
MGNLGNNCLVESMCRHIGQTVTLFTTSGGLSGDGFTGVLISVDCDCVRLLCDIGEAPACPVGSSCTGMGTPFGMWNNNFGGSCGRDFIGNPLGAICVIPTCAIVCFTHNAI